MVFALAGAKLSDTTTGTAYGHYTNHTIPTNFTNGTGTWVVQMPDAEISGVTLYNATTPQVIPANNYSISGGKITAVDPSPWTDSSVNISCDYSYGTYSVVAQQVINDTYGELAEVTDWYSTFIVLGAMVVLILLVVIIINSIKGSGMIQGA